jgi:hypothetical protein
MNVVYSVLYIQTDNPECSEVLGIFRDREKAIDELLERANYRERDGVLTQYMKPTKEYDSFSKLRETVSNSMELRDVDIYRIERIHLVE